MWEKEQDQLSKRLMQIDTKLNKYEVRKRRDSKEHQISIFNMKKDSSSTDKLNLTNVS